LSIWLSLAVVLEAVVVVYMKVLAVAQVALELELDCPLLLAQITQLQ
jgi:hypothetical protein